MRCPVRRQYRRLLAQRYAAAGGMEHRFGVALQPEKETVERELALLDGLGRIPVMLRFYHHRGPAHWAWLAGAARELKRRGCPVAAALVQDRAAVRDPERWRDFAAQVLTQVDGVADWVEVGHAVNRVKWGVWDLREYGRMVQAVADLAPRFPRLKFMGPAGIDFEYPAVLALLNQLPAGFRFQALSHHLYVDRRGAPENTQAGFDLEKKCALARAIAGISPACEDRLILSEVNWPLQGQGVWSPVGSPYASPGPRYGDPSVSEHDYADFMIRYLAAAVCSGMAERVYWWRLTARGYGLVDDTDPAGWRPRPAYEQFRFFLQQARPRPFSPPPGGPGGGTPAGLRNGRRAIRDPDLVLPGRTAGEPSGGLHGRAGRARTRTAGRRHRLHDRRLAGLPHGHREHRALKNPVCMLIPQHPGTTGLRSQSTRLPPRADAHG